MLVSEIELFEALSLQLGAEKARTLVKYVESKVDKRLEENTKLFATKGDISLLKEDILKLQVDIEKRFNQQLIWIVGTSIALGGLMMAIAKFHL